jgi:SAM pointed domain-containing ETS transcription factor
MRHVILCHLKSNFKGLKRKFLSLDEADEQEEMLAEPSQQPSACPPAQHTGGGPIRTGSSNIHLWQFVKELLNQAQHSGCIHWVDKEQGIFKIVDSVRVAELWGKRKNRPAMNFDKLSRSLRQYYKKGIMKKTSRPQRLVYQFCSPYHL